MLKISQKGPFWKYSLKRSFLVRAAGIEEVARNTCTVAVAVPLPVAGPEQMARNLVCLQNDEEVMVEVVEDEFQRMMMLFPSTV